MLHHLYRTLLVLLCAVCVLSGCASHMQYRTDMRPCASATAKADETCGLSSLQRLSVDGGDSYLLGFMEFDDQGQLWDRNQMHGVLDAIEREGKQQDLLILVFAHGWHHSAQPGDGNIETFRNVLSQLTQAERIISASSRKPPRKVVGVYLGWRGDSILGPVVEHLSFWDRKNTATKVGKGSVTEVLTRLEEIKRARPGSTGSSDGTRLIVVGHSFGGLVVQNALTQILQARFIRNRGENGEPGEIEGFGNLVVLINPAFEAMQFIPLSDMASERRRYVADQRPVMAILTSEADYATRYAFPFGRSINTMFEKTRDYERKSLSSDGVDTIDEGSANVTAIGHFAPFRTHRLFPIDDSPEDRKKQNSSFSFVRSALNAALDWQDDKPGSKIRFNDLMLERTANSTGRNPYLLIKVDGRLIKNHNDIDDERIIDFLKELVVVATVDGERLNSLRESLNRK